MAHYHLDRQLSIIKQVGLYTETPTEGEGLRGNAMADIISKLKYDSSDSGMSCRIPLTVYQPLLELGLTDFNDLLIRLGKKPVFLSSDA